MLRRDERLPVAGACLLLLLVTVADVVTDEETVLVSLLVTGPLLAAAFVRPVVTAAVGALTCGLVLLRLAALGEPDRDDAVRLLSVLATLALAVLVAARREQRERQLGLVTDVADAAQAAIRWPVPDRLGDLRFADSYVSADAAARIGGDLYEVVETPHGVRMVVGDVRGKGLPAVRLASVVLGSFREAAQDHADLGDVHRSLDAAVARVASPEDFVSALLVELSPDGSGGRLLSCGHPLPFLLVEGVVTLPRVDAVDSPLGFGCDDDVRPAALHLPAGARLLLHTDGLLEARSRDGAFFPAEQHVAAVAGLPLPEVLPALLARLERHCAGRPGDDVGLLLVERSAPS